MAQLSIWSHITIPKASIETANFELTTRKHFRVVAPIALMLLCLAVYWPVFFHQFLMFWDDQWVALNGYTSGGFNRVNLYNVLTDFYHGQYAPVNELYYMSLYALFGYNPFWFHLAGLLVHISNVLLVFYFFQGLLGFRGDMDKANVRGIAFLTAALMAIHPFLVESVSWVSASKIIVYTLFYLVSLHWYLLYLRTYQVRYYLLTILFFVVSFGGKEQAVVMPLCLVLIDVVTGRSFRQRRVYLDKVPFFLLALFFGLLTIISQQVEKDVTQYPFYQRIAFAGYCLFEYFIKSVLPVNLLYIYPFPNIIGQPLPWRFWIYPVAVLAGIAAFWQSLRRRWIFFGTAFFVIHILVALNLIPTSRFAIIADRYVYLSAVGVCFLVAYVFGQLYLFNRSWRPYVTVALLGYMLYLGVYAHERCKKWHDSDSLKQEVRNLLKQRSDYQEVEIRYR